MIQAKPNSLAVQADMLAITSGAYCAQHISDCGRTQVPCCNIASNCSQSQPHKQLSLKMKADQQGQCRQMRTPSHSDTANMKQQHYAEAESDR